MSRVLVTGMSGVGKSTLLDGLARRGYTVLDTDFDGWVLANGRWDEARMSDLLDRVTSIVVSGTVENQVKFYDRFDHIVLLSAPIDTLIERERSRTTSKRSSRFCVKVPASSSTVEPSPPRWLMLSKFSSPASEGSPHGTDDSTL